MNLSFYGGPQSWTEDELEEAESAVRRYREMKERAVREAEKQIIIFYWPAMAFLFNKKQNICTHIGGYNMNLYEYFKTPLEQTIENIYIENNLLKPTDLSIETIANIFEVDIIIGKLQAFSDNEQKVIFLSYLDSYENQRKSFFTNSLT